MISMKIIPFCRIPSRHKQYRYQSAGFSGLLKKNAGKRIDVDWAKVIIEALVDILVGRIVSLIDRLFGT